MLIATNGKLREIKLATASSLINDRGARSGVVSKRSAVDWISAVAAGVGTFGCQTNQ